MANTITVAQQTQCKEIFFDAAARQEDLLKRVGVSMEAFQRVLLNCLVRNLELSECTKQSIYAAVYRACESGMMPDGRSATIVPLKRHGVKVAEFWPMVYGLATLARENLPGIAFNVESVHDGDEWEDERGTNPRLVHRPNIDGEKRTDKNLIAVYATAHHPGNPVAEFEVIYKAELADFRKNNKGPWSGHPVEMYKVRAFKRLLKRLPLTPKLQAMIGEYVAEEMEPGDENFDGVTIEQDVPEVAEEKPKPARQRKSKAAPEPEPEPESEPEDEVVIDDDPPQPEPEEVF